VTVNDEASHVAIELAMTNTIQAAGVFSFWTFMIINCDSSPKEPRGHQGRFGRQHVLHISAVAAAPPLPSRYAAACLDYYGRYCPFGMSTRLYVQVVHPLDVTSMIFPKTIRSPSVRSCDLTSFIVVVIITNHDYLIHLARLVLPIHDGRKGRAKQSINPSWHP
jgi:hypothetical protein